MVNERETINGGYNMTVYTVKGDLLESDCVFIVHQANCFATMGAGIAKQISRRYPEVLEADRDFGIPVGSKERLGRYSICWVDGTHGSQAVVNLYGQHRYGRSKHTDESALKSGLRSLFETISTGFSSDEVKVGLPYGIGAGFGGGHWPTIEGIINELSDEYGVDVYLYKLK